MNPSIQIILIALAGSLLVPIIMVGLSSVGLFEPLEFNVFGRRFRVGHHKD